MKRAFDPRRWERIRTGGQVRYVLIRGVLMSGALFAAAAAVVEPLAGWIFYGHAYSPPELHYRIIQWIVAGLFCGLLVGIMTWYGGEREYERHRPPKPSPTKRRRRPRKKAKPSTQRKGEDS